MLMEQYGYLGIAFLIAAENIFPPIPSEVILTFGGFMVIVAHLNVWLVILSATIGAQIGAIILYFIGRLISREYLKKIFSGKIGKVFRLKVQNLNNAEKWFLNRGKATVFFCRFIPIVRSLISIPAGISKMNFTVFMIFTTLGTLIWNTILVWLGVYTGESWHDIVNYIDKYSFVMVTLLVILVLGFMIRIVKDNKNIINR